jgi:hypothetical protein
MKSPQLAGSTAPDFSRSFGTRSTSRRHRSASLPAVPPDVAAQLLSHDAGESKPDSERRLRPEPEVQCRALGHIKGWRLEETGSRCLVVDGEKWHDFS